jgi:hypothetical protein
VPVCTWIEPKADSKEEVEAAERARQMQVSSCWVQNLVYHMKGSCIEDLQNKIFRIIFGTGKQELDVEYNCIMRSFMKCTAH